MYIGCAGDLSYGYTGIIDDFRIWNRVLSSNEILSMISDYHHCKVCFRNKNKHCYNCNECNINELHMTCDKCKICYAKYKTRIFNNIQYYHTLNMHIHCKNCDTVKEKDYYFCSKCKQVSE